MREILFRGKRIDDYVNDKSIDYAEKGAREWAYGDIIHRRYYKNKDVVVIRTEDSGFDNYSDYEVDPSTIGQYTGLTANGKKIFEGDIVKVSSPAGSSYYAKIEYDCGCYWISNPDIQIPDTINNFNMEFVEVIGNIHDKTELLDNSELLEDKL